MGCIFSKHQVSDLGNPHSPPTDASTRQTQLPTDDHHDRALDHAQTVEHESVSPIPEAHRELVFLALSLAENRDKRQLFTQLKTGQDKEMVEFLDQILVCDLVAKSPPMRRCVLHTLASLARSVLVFPESLELKGLDRHDLSTVSSDSKYHDLYKIKDFKKRGAVSVKVTRNLGSGRNASDKISRIHAKEVVLRAHLSHPNILPLYGVHVETVAGADGTGDTRLIWIISPWMDNGNLLKYLEKQLAESRSTKSLELMSDVISGLVYLHSHDIVHGDLRAANVFVSGAGRAVLTNFEVSRVMTGQAPYRHQGMSRNSFIEASEKPNFRAPNQPDGLREEEKQVWKDLLIRCWKYSPGERPKSADVLEYFSKWKPLDDAARKDELAKIWQVTRSQSNFKIDYDRVHRILLDVSDIVYALCSHAAHYLQFNQIQEGKVDKGMETVYEGNEEMES
ncbi:Serine/threonine-protein kinase HT1 [Leucoagaricus sp. SymC.cos]|nr:Serine/threonine-protein kinase HT1 [Leucoagaricus sp. SymC.cos]